MKKLLVVLGMITCMAGLVACGEEETYEGPVTEEEAVQAGEEYVANMNAIVSMDAVEQFADAEDPTLYNSLLDWQSALEDIGDYDGTNGGTAVFDEKETVINVNVLGSDHDAVVEMIVDKNGALLGITTNVQYSLGEIMARAGMNTVIGMGTVFAVLILICLIISCFTLVSRIEEKQKKKAEERNPAPAEADAVVSQIVAKEELSDDTELVAVIAAAIAAYEGAASTDGFVVRSIRKSNKTKWQNA